MPDEYRSVLVAAAWLDDIGDSPRLHRSTFHPLDGAWYLLDHEWDRLVAGLVAQHSAAGLVARVRGLERAMRPFDEARYIGGAVPDALTFADQTTGPDGRPMDVEDRLTDMLRRHGPDSPNALCHAQRALAIRDAVRRTKKRIVARG